eukprot:UN03345
MLYRQSDLPNKNNHGLNNPSYKQLGFASLGEMYIKDKAAFDRYKITHETCCGLSALLDAKAAEGEDDVKKQNQKKQQKKNKKDELAEALAKRRVRILHMVKDGLTLKFSRADIATLRELKKKI